MPNKPYLRIEPAKGWSPINFKELWQSRDLAFYLVLREIRSSNHATRLGFLWVILQPLATALVLSIVMGYLVRVPTGETPYPIVVLAGLLIWSYTSNTIMRASNSMITSSYLLTKVYFPRVIIPLVPIISGLVDVLILLVVVVGCCLFYGIYPKTSWLAVFITLPLAVLIAAGFGLWASAFTVRYRDFGNILPVFLQMGLYLSPVFYPSTLVPAHWRRLYELNPIAGLIEITRKAIMGGAISVHEFIYPALFAAVVLAVGVIYFRVSEDFASDVV